MDALVKKVEELLRRSLLRIEHLAEQAQIADVRTRLDALTYVDELKALHAITESKLREFTGGEAGRDRHKAEMKKAWIELRDAMKERSRGDML